MVRSHKPPPKRSVEKTLADIQRLVHTQNVDELDKLRKIKVDFECTLEKVTFNAGMIIVKAKIE